MIPWLLQKIFGTKHERELKKMRPKVAAINDLEPKMRALSDDDLRGLTAKYKERIDNGESLDALLPEAFATCREAGRRVLNMRHFDVQLIGGMVLHRGAIAEMKTGEGKTLVATLPSYLNALSRQGGAHRHGQRLPRHPRRRVDGAHPHRFSGSRRAWWWSTPERPREARRVPRRHHLRAEQRVRLRLPARQHEVLASTTARSGS
jgi:hypothetical protein